MQSLHPRGKHHATQSYNVDVLRRLDALLEPTMKAALDTKAIDRASFYEPRGQTKKGYS